MAKADTFQCTVVTPERPVLDCPARFVAFPAHDGEMGALTHRAPLVCKLGVGVLRVETTDQSHLLLVDGGFAQVVGNRLTILTEKSQKASEVDAAKAEQALIEARAMKISDDASVEARTRAIRSAQVQIKLSRTR